VSFTIFSIDVFAEPSSPSYQLHYSHIASTGISSNSSSYHLNNGIIEIEKEGTSANYKIHNTYTDAEITTTTTGGGEGGSGGGGGGDYNPALCGDGKLHTGEQCDDGNRISHDGCSKYCMFDDIIESDKNENEPIAEKIEIIEKILEETKEKEVIRIPSVTGGSNRTIGNSESSLHPTADKKPTYLRHTLYTLTVPTKKCTGGSTVVIYIILMINLLTFSIASFCLNKKFFKKLNRKK